MEHHDKNESEHDVGNIKMGSTSKDSGAER